MGASQRTIPRERVIPGAWDDEFHVDGLIHSDDRVKTRSITIARAAMQGLNATPVVLLPTKTGRRYIVLGAHVSKAAGAYGGGDDVTLNFINADNDLAATFASATFGEAGAQTAWATLPARTGTPAAQTYPAEGIDANVGTAFTGAGGAVTITVLYVERDDDHDVDDTLVPKNHTVTLNAAAVHALDTTPFTVLAAKAGKKFLVLGAHISKGAAAYTGGAAVALRYTSAGTPTVVSFPAARFTGGAANAWVARAAYTGAPAEVSDPEGGLELSTGTTFAGAGADVEVTVRYVEVDE